MTDSLLLPGTDPLSKSLYELERIFASSPTLQALLSVSTVTDAKALIKHTDADGKEQRPTVCCSIVNPLRYEIKAGGDQNYLRPTGEAWIYIACDTPADVLADADAGKAELMWAAKTFGGIASEVAALANTDQTFDSDDTDSHLGITTLNLLDFSRSPEQVWHVPGYGRFWWGVFAATWGDGE